MGAFKKISLMCLSITVLYPVAFSFGTVKQTLLIAVTGLIVKFSSGDIVDISPLRFAVAVAFTVTAFSYISILFPITSIPLTVLVLALCGVLVLIDYRTKGKYEWYARTVIIPIILVCIICPEAWGVNELFYGSLLHALRLPNWVGRGMIMIDAFLIKRCRLVSLPK